MAVQEYGGSDSEGVEALSSATPLLLKSYSNFQILLRWRREERYTRDHKTLQVWKTRSVSKQGNEFLLFFSQLELGTIGMVV